MHALTLITVLMIGSIPPTSLNTARFTEKDNEQGNITLNYDRLTEDGREIQLLLEVPQDQVTLMLFSRENRISRVRALQKQREEKDKELLLAEVQRIISSSEPISLPSGPANESWQFQYTGGSTWVIHDVDHDMKRGRFVTWITFAEGIKIDGKNIKVRAIPPPE